MKFTGNKRILNDNKTQYQYFIGYCAGYKPLHQDLEVLLKSGNRVKTFEDIEKALRAARKLEKESFSSGSPFARRFYYWSYKKTY